MFTNKIKITATMTSKNQITIPKTVRDILDLKQNDQVEFTIQKDGSITIAPKESFEDFWKIVEDQEKKYGNVSSPETDWGPDQGSEVID
ncbi:AbrB/MazE/SpoVT family DNA-binding domain-containing protein [Fructilactobacillus fructivorans]|uniref:AbrB/MazE/SpoVT family DNA-binding domain-containing protein n=1 Tax=Fructilactobacillus fructivorans TaxID=1614 RepID=A0AAE6NZC8_9LACO|nr:type II toxin-antitoxin system PrlF family antitoxin [Fructilactobacillus fructivorans]KRK58257.1 AbrB family transcriptional regulator [Fructilactobacillus fructivorans]KRN40865.1 AbrB family transcriptional regulator [Fructilactobacillus fructivorans]KRN42460.1 AbrB family transcriptional regulator [Fructilactobacillus fructivorans]QFX92241.1 AbrB/MazE/SpoVT family DNA-binding domain-containing protein [Fructilactobacillus fructivorans]RDV65290.1 AbrB/MazE/SpoVT family DNA-binding domain-